MKLYKSMLEPIYKTTGKYFKDKNWELLGELPNRPDVLRYEVENITEKEIRDHLRLTKEFLQNVINNIEQIELKI